MSQALGHPMARGVSYAAVAGVLATIAFTVLHQMISSNIWFTLPVMAPIGAFCGITLYWSFTQLSVPREPRSWFVYHAVHLGVLSALGLTSILVFEPVTTVAALIAANEAPRELTTQALPLIAPFTVLWAAVFSAAWTATWRARAVMLLNCTLLMAALGLNIAILGLVEIPLSAANLVVRLFVMTSALILGFAAIFYALDRHAFDSGSARAPGVRSRTVTLPGVGSRPPQRWDASTSHVRE